jgi:hypothetical protein
LQVAAQVAAQLVAAFGLVVVVLAAFFIQQAQCCPTELHIVLLLVVVDLLQWLVATQMVTQATTQCLAHLQQSAAATVRAFNKQAVLVVLVVALAITRIVN